MPSKKYALGAFLLLATVGLAQNQIHIVKSGDTLGQLASKYGVSTKQIASANRLKESSTLGLGKKLTIPGRISTAKPASGLTVRKGDTDAKIAKRIGTTVAKLRAANPNVKWTRLQIGQTLRGPGSTVASAKPVAGGAYTVRQGDNDWLIARKFGISLAQLRSLNQGRKLDRIQPGQVLRVPGKASAAPVMAASLKSRWAFATGDGVNLRTQPRTDAAKVGELIKGSRVAIVDREGDWYRVRTENNKRGWVRGDLLKEAPRNPVAVLAAKKPATMPVAKPSRLTRGSKPSTPVEISGRPALLDHAYAMRGTRYVWGGTSRSGVDCSGFTTNVFRSQGISLPRTSRDQSRIGVAVEKSELRPGDLVFFRTNRKSYINHVGIYSGDGKFIHSSSGQGGVRVDRIDSGYYSRQFVSARRVSSKLKGMTVAAKTSKKPAAVVKEEVASDEKLVPVTPAETTPKLGTDAIIK